MIARITGDVDQLQTGINLTLRLFLRSPFVVLGAMIMAFTVDTRSALVFVVAIPLLMLAVFGILFLTLPLYRKVRGGLDSLLLSAKENLEGVRVLRAFGQEEKEIDSFSREKCGFHPSFAKGRSNFRTFESPYLSSFKYRRNFSFAAGRMAGGYRCAHKGRGRGTVQLYVPDPCRADQICQSDHYGDQSRSVRFPDFRPYWKCPPSRRKRLRNPRERAGSEGKRNGRE